MLVGFFVVVDLEPVVDFDDEEDDEEEDGFFVVVVVFFVGKLSEAPA